MTQRVTRIEAAALRMIAERPSRRIHFQCCAGGLRTLLSLERKGLVIASADGYWFALAR